MTSRTRGDPYAESSPDYIVETLTAAGVEQIFGVVGHSLKYCDCFNVV